MYSYITDKQYDFLEALHVLWNPVIPSQPLNYVTSFLLSLIQKFTINKDS